MPLFFVVGDIVRMHVDAIVNAANTTLLGGGGVDGCIHRAAGPELLEECRTLGGCAVGMAKITHGYRLPCKYVVHTVGPVWKGGQYGERQQLVSCYRTSLELARKYHCETVAFPLISAGAYRYPKDEALWIAVTTIDDFLSSHDMTVYIVIFDSRSFCIDRKLLEDVAVWIDNRSAHRDKDEHTGQAEKPSSGTADSSMRMLVHSPAGKILHFYQTAPLEKSFEQMEETFVEMLCSLIKKRGLDHTQCYRRANLDRKLFSRIIRDPGYHLSRNTAIALAIALELSLDETQEFLKHAGYALSRSSTSDLIVEYFISNRIYDINRINEALFAFNQKMLGQQ